MDWQPIETAPSRIPVLLYCPDIEYSNSQIDENPNIVIGVKCASGVWDSSIGDVEGSQSGYGFVRQQLKPTHWMPLPESPKSE